MRRVLLGRRDTLDLATAKPVLVLCAAAEAVCKALAVVPELAPVPGSAERWRSWASTPRASSSWWPW